MGWGPFSNVQPELFGPLIQIVIIYMYISINCSENTMIIMSASTNSPIWAKIFIKRVRFLGKFKKGPPHIGEYEKKVHF